MNRRHPYGAFDQTVLFDDLPRQKKPSCFMRQPGVRDVPRQPGCLHKIRGFPSLPRDRFGLLREVIYFKRLYDDALDLSNLRAEIYPAAKGM